MPSVSGWSEWEFLPACSLCGAARGLQGHHKVYRSRGGSDGEANLVLLCIVCHAAVHGIAAVFEGHSCRTCAVPIRDGCHFGEIVAGRTGPNGTPTPPPWNSRIEEGS